MIYKTQADLDAALVYWQKELRLSEWRIFLRFAKAGEINARGMCTPLLELMEAEIIITPLGHDYFENWYDHDHEETLVHELLHCHMEPLKPDDDRDALPYRIWEQTIDQLAKAIVKINGSM